MAEINFAGRVAIVTGAGNGLGRDYALELARRGAKILVNDLGGSASGVGASNSAAEQVVQEIRDLGGEAVASTHSVATRESGAAIVQTALDAWGKVDILISNAGFLRNNRFEDLTDEQIDPILDVHLKAAFYVGQPAYRAMRAQNYGRMLFTGSASAMFGHAWQANYAAGKAAMLGLSNVIAIEGSAYGINSNVILPTAASFMFAAGVPGLGENLVTLTMSGLTSSTRSNESRKFSSVSPGNPTMMSVDRVMSSNSPLNASTMRLKSSTQ